MTNTNQNSPYNESIANEYDKHAFIWTLYPPLIHKLFSLNKQHSVLDMGCGTGSLLIAVHNQIGNGLGIDISPTMIARANDKEVELGIENLAFKVCNIVDYSSDDKYDLILCTDGVLPYLGGNDDLNVVFKNIKRAINRNGLAVLEFWTHRANVPPSDGINEIPPEIASITAEMLGESFLCEITKLPKAGRIRYRFHCPDQLFSYTVLKSETTEELHRFYFVSPDEIRENLLRHGFQVLGEYGIGKQLGKFALMDFEKGSTIWTVALCIR